MTTVICDVSDPVHRTHDVSCRHNVLQPHRQYLRIKSYSDNGTNILLIRTAYWSFVFKITDLFPPRPSQIKLSGLYPLRINSEIMNLTDDSLDGVSASRKAVTYTGQHTHRINADIKTCLKWDSNQRYQCLRGRNPLGHSDRRLVLLVPLTCLSILAG
jgi:hypothetical protein